MSEDKVMPEKAILTSLDIGESNRAQVKQMFPSVFTETFNDKGELVESIDFEKLKGELGTFSDVFEARRERYGMDWPGKKECMKLIQKPSIATLKPCREESVNFDVTENLFIEGDNLEVLKLLQKSYYGKIKMIYIDPPYNTGNDFIYPDDFSETISTYRKYAGLENDGGLLKDSISANTKDRPQFHTKWMNMMYPRLYLARNLLRDSGVIFISIDEGEAKNLRRICDEIFGEDNFVEQVVWKNKYGSGALTKGFANVHEYVVVYSKSSIANIAAPLSDEQKKTYKGKDSKFDVRGGFITQPLATTSKDERPNLVYPILHEGHEIWPEKQWIWSKERFEEAYKNDEIVINEEEGKFSVRMKQYLRDEKGIERLGKPISILNGPFNQEGTKEIRELFGKPVFDFPKPSNLIKYFFSCIVNDDLDDTGGIYLDFFAGSAASAHAVLQLNLERSGNRQFIMVQLPEPCDENTVAYKEGLGTIADVGKERIRRVLKLHEEVEAKKAIESEGDLLRSKESQDKLDLGFKVLKLDKSNFKVWDGAALEPTDEKIAKQLEAFVEHIDPKASQEDILFELLLKAGFKPTESIEKKEIAGKTVFCIAEGLLLICLEDEITKELIEAIAAAEPLQFICLDRGFKGNDQLKANAVQTFAARNQGRDKQDQIVFRTV